MKFEFAREKFALAKQVIAESNACEDGLKAAYALHLCRLDTRDLPEHIRWVFAAFSKQARAVAESQTTGCPAEIERLLQDLRWISAVVEDECEIARTYPLPANSEPSLSPCR